MATHRIALWIAAFLLPSAVINAATAVAPGAAYTVAFGSYTQYQNAETQRAQVLDRLAIEARIDSFTQGDRTLYRVIANSRMASGEASALVARARRDVFGGAWRIPLERISIDETDQPVEIPDATAPPIVLSAPTPRPTPAQISSATRTPPRTMAEANTSVTRPTSAPESETLTPPTLNQAPQVAPQVAPSVVLTTPEPTPDTSPASDATPTSSKPTAAKTAADRPLITVPQFDSVDIKLDGLLDESIWKEVPGHDDMLVIEPDHLISPQYSTKAHYLYTDRGMYIGVKMEQPPETMIARLSSRDAFINRDSYGITLDTSGEGLYGYWFTVNLGGSVMDGKVLPERQFSREWDGPWRWGTAELDDGWSTELFLPWSMMAMPKNADKRKIGFWANRKVAYIDERWSTPALPFTNARFMSALGTLEFENVEPGAQFAVFPYASYTYDEIEKEDEYRGGLDVFWRPSTNLQLAATLNPDFGAVESDDVVVNLTAFETFFPEKRLFFVEGNEVFETTPRSRSRSGGASSSGSRQTVSTFTPTPTTLLNTRRIGGTPRITVPDDVDIAGVELGRPTELAGAVKLTGQSGGFRYGMLGAFEEDVRRQGTRNGAPIRLEQEGRDFGVARILYEQKNDRGRWAAGYMGTLVDRPTDDEAIVHGVDTHLLALNGKLTWDTQLVASDVDAKDGYGAFMNFRYVPNREWSHFLDLDYSNDELDISDLGFIRRNDALGFVYGMDFNTSANLKRLRNRRWQVIVSYEQNDEQLPVRGGLFVRHFWTFKNLARINTEFDYFPARYDDRNSFGNGIFKTEDRWVAEVGFGTDTSKSFSFSGLLGTRQEELGGWTTRVSAGVTIKPNDRFSLDLDLNFLRRDGWLVYQDDRDFTTFSSSDWQPRLALDYFINARQQLRLTMQWAGIRADEQEFWRVPLRRGDLLSVTKAPGEPVDDFTISRLTAQLRYRWEIGPLSDLFVVYTRGSNLPNRRTDEFVDLFDDALNTPIVDVLVVKLRYRFGR